MSHDIKGMQECRRTKEHRKDCVKYSIRKWNAKIIARKRKYIKYGRAQKWMDQQQQKDNMDWGIAKSLYEMKIQKNKIIDGRRICSFWGKYKLTSYTLFYLWNTLKPKTSVTKKYDSEKSQITKPHLWKRLYSFIVKLKAINISCDKSTKESKNTTYRKCAVQEWMSASKNKQHSITKKLKSPSKKYLRCHFLSETWYIIFFQAFHI